MNDFKVLFQSITEASNHLDNIGFFKEADAFDSLLEKYAHFSPDDLKERFEEHLRGEIPKDILDAVNECRKTISDHSDFLDEICKFDKQHPRIHPELLEEDKV